MIRPGEMARVAPLVLLVLFGQLPPAGAAATELGLDAGAPVWGGEVASGVWDAVASTGVPWVRVNFRLDLWSAPDDPGRHGSQQLTWFQVYDRIVDAYLARGLRVYGLLNDELVKGVQDLNSDQFAGAFVQNAVKVIDHFKDRVRVFEVINEPNDWAGGSTSRFQAQSFARILQQTYLAVKHAHAADPCWQVTLLSGPLFSFDGVSAADYLASTYAAGKSLGWEQVRSQTGSYPLDGIGYHLYVAQGAEHSLADVKSSVQANLDAIWSTVTAAEPAGSASAKRIWISEYGFRADAVGAPGQADRLEAAFLQMKAHGKVQLAVYFQVQDFPGNLFGVFSEGGLDPAHRRPAADRLLALAQANRPAQAAHLFGLSVPTLRVGQPGQVTLTLENRGSSSWQDGSWRLGAGPGCPSSTVPNQISWDPAGGYAKSPTDARFFLPAAVAPGAKLTVAVPVRAPAQPGKVRFAARMLQEGVSWFGSTAVLEVLVEPGSGPPPADGGVSGWEAGRPLEPGPGSGGNAPPVPPGADSGSSLVAGCGCAAAPGRSAAPAMLVAGLWWLVRRRRWPR